VPDKPLLTFDWLAALPFVLQFRRQLYGWTVQGLAEDLTAYAAEGSVVLCLLLTSGSLGCRCRWTMRWPAGAGGIALDASDDAGAPGKCA
jgi:hypothetical protein